MRLSFEYNKYKITYNVIYKKRTGIAINVESNGEVNVLAPLGTSVHTVMDKVKGHGAFILYELSKIAIAQQKQKSNTNLKPKQVTEPQQCMYLGKHYGIEKIENAEVTQTTVKLIRGKFVIEAQAFEPQTVRDELCLWYINKGDIKAKERMKAVKEAFERIPKKITVDVLPKSLWEIEEDNIVLNVNTMIGPVNVLDATLVEALCHFNKIEDSTDKTSSLVEGYEEAQAWLQNNKDKFLFY